MKSYFIKKKKKFFIICIQVFWEVVQSLNTYIKLKAWTWICYPERNSSGLHVSYFLHVFAGNQLLIKNHLCISSLSKKSSWLKDFQFLLWFLAETLNKFILSTNFKLFQAAKFNEVVDDIYWLHCSKKWHFSLQNVIFRVFCQHWF